MLWFILGLCLIGALIWVLVYWLPKFLEPPFKTPQILLKEMKETKTMYRATLTMFIISCVFACKCAMDTFDKASTWFWIMVAVSMLVAFLSSHRKYNVSKKSYDEYIAAEQAKELERLNEIKRQEELRKQEEIRRQEELKRQEEIRRQEEQQRLENIRKQDTSTFVNTEKTEPHDEKISGLSNEIVSYYVGLSRLENTFYSQYDVDEIVASLEVISPNIDYSVTLNANIEDEIPLKSRYNLTKEVKMGNYVAFDIETTGLSPYKHNIIELSAVRFRNFEAVQGFSTLINPQQNITKKITEITGLTNDDVKNAPLICQVIDSFAEFVGKDAMVGHNILRFDLEFLHKIGFNIAKPARSYIDTLVIAKRIICKDDIENYKLATLLEYFDIFRTKEHRGIPDSVAEGILLAKLISK